MRTKAALAVAVAVAVALCAAGATAAAQPELSGSVGYQMHYGFLSGTVDWDRLQLRLDLDGWLGQVLGYHASVMAYASLLPQPAVGLALGEAYIDGSLGPVDFRAGSIVVRWGVADGINPTNVVNPASSGTSPAAALDVAGAARKPVPGVEVTYYSDDGMSALTGVLVLGFVPGQLDGEFAEAAETAPGMSERFPEGVEFALRGETMLGGYNVYASYFRGRQDLPAAWMEGDELKLQYRRMHHFGLAVAGSIGGAAVWTEGGLDLPDRLPQLEPGASDVAPMSSNRPRLQLVAGAEYTFDVGRGLFTSVQAIYDSAGALVSPYGEPGEAGKAGLYAMVVGRYSLADDHDLQLVALADVLNRSVLAMPTYSWTMAPAVELSVTVVAGYAPGGLSAVDTMPGGAAMAGAAGVTAGIKASF